jgi:hypothetical protein
MINDRDKKIAGQEGFEPSPGDSISNINACKLVVNPILLIYFFFRAPETGGCVCLDLSVSFTTGQY